MTKFLLNNILFFIAVIAAFLLPVSVGITALICAVVHSAVGRYLSEKNLAEKGSNEAAVDQLKKRVGDLEMAIHLGKKR